MWEQHIYVQHPNTPTTPNNTNTYLPESSTRLRTML
jgi:hypothetical protein